VEYLFGGLRESPLTYADIIIDENFSLSRCKLSPRTGPKMPFVLAGIKKDL